MEHKQISTDKFSNISYRVGGNGPAIVLLHGFPLDHTLWNDITGLLTEKHTVITPDLPGAGQSSLPADEELSMENMAEAIKDILDAEGVNTAIIAGHSMGGYVSVAFAELFPEKLAGLAFVHSMATADSEEKKEQRRKSIELFNKGGKEPFIRQMVPGLFSERSKQRLSEDIKRCTEVALKTATGSLSAFYNAMINRPGRTSKLYSKDFPVLWIIGENDKIAAPENLMQQTTLTNVNFVYVYENCGHMSMIEFPDLLAKHMLNFIKYCYEREKE